METQRLKNIIILVLALLNVFLLVLLLHFRWQEKTSEQLLTERIYHLYESSGLGLAEEEKLSLDSAAPQSLTLQRSLSHESAIAAWLLEEEVAGEHQGGGIYTYATPSGTVTFRSNGAFDYAPADCTVSSPMEYSEAFCREFGYRIDHHSISGNSGTITAERMLEDVAVYNGTVSFLYENGKLISLSGYCFSTAGSVAAEAQQLSASDALVKFLDYRKVSGAVCSAVTGVDRVYDLHSAGQVTTLVAKWQVSTDTYRYYVDCSTGDISRA